LLQYLLHVQDFQSVAKRRMACESRIQVQFYPERAVPLPWKPYPRNVFTELHQETQVKLFRTTAGSVVERSGQYYTIEGMEWHELLAQEDLSGTLNTILEGQKPGAAFDATELLAPIDRQEVWAAGVTYYRSRGARMEESKDAGGGSFYDRVYSAERPELFFKSTASRTVGSGGKVKIRADSMWNVPEPELTLLVSPLGRVAGYTIGNDMSSRDIEGENPLYLPQAKVYHGSCALGPGILVSAEPLALSTEIAIEILRGGKVEFAGQVALTELKRDPQTLVEYLFRDNVFPQGCFLMTGTGIVPPSSFTLASGDLIRITIQPIGTLQNVVA
jgi:2-dehydro-3-deoxy-D-arabinonate dehydratase